MFFRQHKENTTLLVCVDDIIIRGDDEGEIAELKVQLGNEFEVKNLNLLRYFLGIEVVLGVGVVLSQRKYIFSQKLECWVVGL